MGWMAPASPPHSGAPVNGYRLLALHYRRLSPLERRGNSVPFSGYTYKDSPGGGWSPFPGGDGGPSALRNVWAPNWFPLWRLDDLTTAYPEGDTGLSTGTTENNIAVHSTLLRNGWRTVSESHQFNNGASVRSTIGGPVQPIQNVQPVFVIHITMHMLQGSFGNDPSSYHYLTVVVDSRRSIFSYHCRLVFIASHICPC
jgi:hypothetical protein